MAFLRVLTKKQGFFEVVFQKQSRFFQQASFLMAFSEKQVPPRLVANSHCLSKKPPTATKGNFTKDSVHKHMMNQSYPVFSWNDGGGTIGSLAANSRRGGWEAKEDFPVPVCCETLPNTERVVGRCLNLEL